VPITGGVKPAPVLPSMPSSVAFDITLEHPRSVFQLLKQQYSRYTPEMVERITGINKDQFIKAADLFTSIRKDGDMKKVATIIYAVGWTQHSFGTQIIRTAAMLQLLLGNVGRAGGGVNALRGHSNIQGATDVAGIFDNLPGYLKIPAVDDKDFDSWMKRITPTSSKPSEWDSFNYYSNTPKFAVSLMKAMYGVAATKENHWAFDYLPKVDREYSWAHIFDDMYQDKLKGLIAFGMNAVAIGPNSQKEYRRAQKAKFLVVCDIYPGGNQRFLASPRHYPRTDQGHSDRSLPPARRGLRGEKTGPSSTPRAGCNGSGPPCASRRREARPGNSRRVFSECSRALQKRRRSLPRSDSEPDVELHYPRQSVAFRVAKELNGRDLATGQQLPGFAALKDDGTTACGNWIWCGSWTEAGALTQRRDNSDPSGQASIPTGHGPGR